MIILDTNVVSEAMKPNADAVVRAWLNAQAAETLYLSTITLAEILYGIEALPDGKRKDGLAQALEEWLTLFTGRLLSFDAESGKQYAYLAVSAKKQGLGFPVPDGYIAAIAASRQFMVASRDTAPYEAGGITVINPWVAQ